MNKLDFVRKLYRGKNCYSDPLTPEEIELIHIRSTTENIISQMLEDKKIIFLTGNPGDGKTYIIKALDSVINKVKAYVEMDLSSIEDYSDIVENIKQCYENGSACIIAANEYPFIKLEKAMGEKYPEISEEIRDVKKNSIVYGVPSFECGRIVVVDRSLASPAASASAASSFISVSCASSSSISQVVCFISSSVRLAWSTSR